MLWLKGIHPFPDPLCSPSSPKGTSRGARVPKSGVGTLCRRRGTQLGSGGSMPRPGWAASQFLGHFISLCPGSFANQTRVVLNGRCENFCWAWGQILLCHNDCWIVSPLARISTAPSNSLVDETAINSPLFKNPFYLCFICLHIKCKNFCSFTLRCVFWDRKSYVNQGKMYCFVH